MTYLNEAQAEVARQLHRDYPEGQENELLALFSLGLVEEAGEVAGLTKRMMRFKLMPTSHDKMQDFTNEKYLEECGDVMWYLMGLCSIMGLSLQEVWDYNVKKLEARYGK